MPAHDVIRRKAIPLTVTRPITETVTDGFVVPGTEAVPNVTGHMQPMSDRELRYMPEGMNTLESWNIWTLQEIKVGDQITDGSAPTVTVVRIKYWKEGTFYHAQGTVVDDTGGTPGA